MLGAHRDMDFLGLKSDKFNEINIDFEIPCSLV